MNIFDGTLKRSGRMAYLEQEPWIVSGSVKENITLGFPFDESRYNETVNACGLRDDIDRMQNGDETRVGEKGVTLSGGQKARLALARCVYADCDIYLLDDPLSAVDVRIGRHIFDN
jgi:ATP-binding cassette subfamily C (CFTR/MRP) protein 4